MRRLAFIMFLLAATVFVVAGNMISPQKRRAKGKAVTVDSLPNPNDTTQMDSLEKAVWLRNKAVDDSIHLDSLNKQKKNSIEMPVDYTANDSMVYDATSRKVHLFGKANVKYEGMDLESEKIAISLDSSIVHATGVKDTAKKALSGTPVFTMGNDSYESDTIAFNFKSKKGLINNVKTEQQEGYITSQLSKRMDNGDIYLQHGRYTTCDKEHPDFYIALSRAKVRPNKDVVFGPAYLVVADVPLPLAIPYGFFPFTKHYSSGFIMPTYGDENDRGFYLRDGGYYFAMSDKWDLKLLGEIYTKGSWGISAASNYNKRYKYSGSVYFSYQNTKTGDKGMPDYTKQESFKIQWSHRQDAKANPFSTLAASVNFATSSYERNNLNSMYNPQTMTQSTRTSSVSWSTGFSSLGMTLSSSANLSQNMRTNELSMTLPDLNVNVSRFYPFRRKQMVGKERWYEKISMSYTGQLSNSITTNEDHLLHSDLAKEWSNGIQHNIPVNGNFTLAKYINITLGFNFTDRMYFKKENMQWDQAAQAVAIDTTYGFYNVYNWNASIGASTKFYGMFIPNRKIFGDKIQAIRHVFTPTVSFSYAPDFGNKYYETYQRTNSDGSVELVEYSPYRSGLYSVPGKGKTGSITMQVSNNIEMKIRSDKDSTGIKKISIIDELGAQMSYNFATSYHRWSDLSTNLRLKWWKNYTFNLNAVFATYAYELDKNGHPYVGNHTEYSKGRFGRFQGMSQNISFTLTPDKLKKLFGGSVDDNDNKKNDNDDEDEGVDTDIESNVDDNLVKGQHGAKKKSGGSKAETDDDGYMRFSMPWSLTFGYGVTMRENTSGKFNTKSMRYPYKFTQTLNVSGNLRISDGWNISFSSGYDFDNHALSMTTASLQRDLHCFNMSCSVVLKPYTSYNFSFRANASTLMDALKYDKRSGYSNAVQWY
ncbi:MAG: putative LPS assembly protein LptD [Prevotella sp.]